MNSLEAFITEITLFPDRRGRRGPVVRRPS